jgi:hypothetical protein
MSISVDEYRCCDFGARERNRFCAPVRRAAFTTIIAISTA